LKSTETIIKLDTRIAACQFQQFRLVEEH